jgi:hypothetical protein
MKNGYQYSGDPLQLLSLKPLYVQLVNYWGNFYKIDPNVIGALISKEGSYWILSAPTLTGDRSGSYGLGQMTTETRKPYPEYTRTSASGQIQATTLYLKTCIQDGGSLERGIRFYNSREWSYHPYKIGYDHVTTLIALSNTDYNHYLKCYTRIVNYDKLIKDTSVKAPATTPAPSPTRQIAPAVLAKQQADYKKNKAYALKQAQLNLARLEAGNSPQDKIIEARGVLARAEIANDNAKMNKPISNAPVQKPYSKPVTKVKDTKKATPLEQSVLPINPIIKDKYYNFKRKALEILYVLNSHI